MQMHALSRSLLLLPLTAGLLFAASQNFLITSIAGTGEVGAKGDEGLASQAAFNTPFGVARDRSGNLYVADYANAAIRVISVDGRIHHFASVRATDLAISPQGDVYASEFDDNQVVRIKPGGTVVIVAGLKGRFDFGGDGGPGVNAGLNGPRGLAFDSSGNLYIAALFDNRVRMLSPDGIIHTVAGNGSRDPGIDGALATAVGINRPTGVAVDAAGNIFISDQNGLIRKVTAGVMHSFGGAANSVQATSLAAAADGSIVFTETFQNRIRQLLPDGTFRTIAGDGLTGFAGDGGPAAFASFNEPSGIAADAQGNLWIADTYNFRIRQLQPAQIFPLFVLNGASLLNGAIVSGEVISMFGYDLPTGSTRVLFDNTPGQVLYSSASLVNVIVPPLPSETTGVHVRIVANQDQANPQATNEIVLAVARSAPGIFTLDQDGQGFAVALNEDGRLNTQASPAAAGSTIRLFATGLSTNARPEISIGTTAQLKSVRPAAGLPGGVFEIEAIVPGASTQQAPVAIIDGGQSSQKGVAVWTRPLPLSGAAAQARD
jgi:uncharacterized protein (TIGR03437 family)